MRNPGSLPLAALILPMLSLALAAPGRSFTQAEIDQAALVAEQVQSVAMIAADTYNGRDNNTADSLAVQSFLIAELSAVADGLNAGETGDAAYKQLFATSATGTNLLAVIPGTDLADEYVMIGAHYDHLGRDATGIFNGATDNAAGTAAVLAIGKAFQALPAAPRRSIILALWDAEEDGLAGSAAFATSPLVPLSSIVAYINFDILGSNLLPSLRNNSFAIGAESGGTALQNMTTAAVARESLDTSLLSRLFGQERSDHASFIDIIPSVFFGDGTGPCYHTTGDDITVVDLGKLRVQSRIAFRLAVDLAETSTPPAWVPTTVFSNTYEDAIVIADILNGAVADLALFGPSEQATLLANQQILNDIVAAGPGAFDSEASLAIATAAVDALAALETLECDGFLAEAVPFTQDWGKLALLTMLCLGGFISLRRTPPAFS